MDGNIGGCRVEARGCSKKRLAPFFRFLAFSFSRLHYQNENYEVDDVCDHAPETVFFEDCELNEGEHE